jgi:biopolymer transport protein ExbD
MGGGGGNMEGGEPEFQIAPMIDVLLVLLIFFMSITTSQVLKIDKEIKLPIAEHAKKKPASADISKEGALNVRWNISKQESTLMYDDKIYKENVDDLIEILRRRSEVDSQFRVILRGDKNLPAVEIQRAMSVIAQGGISDITFSTINQ